MTNKSIEERDPRLLKLHLLKLTLSFVLLLTKPSVKQGKGKQENK